MKNVVYISFLFFVFLSCKKEIHPNELCELDGSSPCIVLSMFDSNKVIYSINRYEKLSFTFSNLFQINSEIPNDSVIRLCLFYDYNKKYDVKNENDTILIYENDSLINSFSYSFSSGDTQCTRRLYKFTDVESLTSDSIYYISNNESFKIKLYD